jgi:hypothetical protein
MKIALCLHGVVGNLYTNKDDRVWKEDVDYRLGLEHYRRRLFSVNDADIDVFIHSWSTAYEQEIRRDYQPKSCLFEEQIDFGKANVVRHFNRSRWYSTKATVALKRAYEREHGFEYDWVVLSRFDLALFKDLVLSKYDPEFFYPGHHEWKADTIFVKEEPMFCDFFYYATSRKIDAFSTLYDDLDRIEVENAHWQSLIHAKRLGFSLRSDFRKADEFELIRYVYEDCHYRGDAYPGEAGFVRKPEYPVERFGM